MSGTTTLTLAETPPDAATALPPGTDLPALHTALAAEIGTHLGPAHAALFARPVPGPGKLLWTTQGADLRRFADLAADDRRALLAAAGAILSDVRRLVESGRAPALARVWPAARAVPNPNSLFAVDGGPVLAPWGATGESDLLGAYDDGLAWSPPPRVAWLPYAAALAAVALLALAAGLLLPTVARWAVPEPAMCRLEPGQLDLLRQQADAEVRGDELKRLLAATNDDIGRRQLQCPIPQVQAAIPPPPAPPAPAPAATPPPRAELPADRWNEHDLSMLDGCWHSTTQMMLVRESNGEVRSVQEWRLCFDNGGRGRQSIRLTDGTTCNGPMSASFGSGDRLLMADTARCSGSSGPLRQGFFDCSRINDNEATCTRVTTEGPRTGAGQTGRFRR